MLERVVIATVLVACGSTATAPQAPMENTVERAKTEVHRWRESMIEAAVKALAVGDVETLVGLAEPAVAFENASACEKQRRDTFGEAASKAKGSEIQIVSILLEKRDPDRAVSFGTGCNAKTTLAVHDVIVRARVARDGRSSRQKLRLQLVETGGAYYLTKVPEHLDRGGASDAIAKMKGFTDRMCQCADKACADQVQEDMTKWGTEAARTAEPDDRPDPDMIKQAGEIMTRYTECMTKLMMSGTP